MSRAVSRVDRAILAWMAETPDPAATLAGVERRFLDMGGRLGYVIAEGVVAALTGGTEGVTSLNVTPGGTLTGKISDDECSPAIDWDNGVLSIWNGADALPETMMAQLAGRRIGDVVGHRWLPEQGVITQVEESGAWLRLHCQEFSTSIEEARAELAGVANTD